MEADVLGDYARICYETNLEFAKKNIKLPSLEIGTCRGGSAMAFLKSLRLVWRSDPPMLFTVDPYGNKDYPGSQETYGDNEYLEAKRNLAIYPNHAHFLLAGIEFINYLPFHYWDNGQKYSLTRFGFAFLDGQHDALTVLAEAYSLS